MSDSHDYDFKGMMEALRSQVREQRRSEPSSSPLENGAPAPGQELRGDLAELHQGYDLTRVSLNPNRRFLGRVMLAAANAVSALLTPIIRHQSQYNAANTRLISSLQDDVARLQGQFTELRTVAEGALSSSEKMNLLGRRTARMYAAEFANHTELLHQLSQRLGAVEQRFQQYEKDLSSQVERNYEEVGKQVEAHFSKLVAEVEAARSHFEQFKATRERVMRVERRLRRLLDGERPAIAAGAQPDEAPSSHTETADEFEYAGFEDHLRDSEVVKARQLRYVEHFAGQAPVLDIGCGKGEFLMLMREAGIEAGGIDLDLDMVLECRENGLKVERCDAIDYLERQPDESIGAIFSAQVIEHLTSAQLSRLVVLACRKLKPGGTMILETLNPESIFVQYRWFWMDPSHVRLVHPEMLRYLLESTGFTQSSCHYISPPPDVSKIPPLQIGTNGELEDFNRATEYLNRLLYGDQEYYIVARK